MSFQEKAALFQEWFSSLPPAYRRKLYEQLSGNVAGATTEAPQESDDATVN
jgi:hypothetical protein